MVSQGSTHRSKAIHSNQVCLHLDSTHLASTLPDNLDSTLRSNLDSTLPVLLDSILGNMGPHNNLISELIKYYFIFRLKKNCV